MKILVFCITINFLFFINAVYSVEVTPQQPQVNYQKDSIFNLACNVSFEGEGKPTITWYRDSKKVSEVDDLKSRISQKWDNNVNILSIEKATEKDAANYSCVANQGSDEKQKASIAAVFTKAVAVKVPTNINVVEENTLRIECRVAGDPVLHWIFKNESYDVSRDQVKLENYTDDGKFIKNGVFIVENITLDDRGFVICVGDDLYSGQSSSDQCMVRVTGKYAALWPFLGICAEVIVLCAIIVIYEKKRNKTELEESDTDQSPDQKNTPDHGKEANLRHRQ